jgi:predicted nucleic acid-binding protein
MEYKNIIIDSSVWISAFNKEDSNNKKALSYESYFENEQWMPDIIFYEVLSVLKNKIKDRSLLNDFVDYTKNNGNISIRLFYEYNREVLKTFIYEKSGTLSYVDALLVYLSHEYTILTFDKDLKDEIKKIGGNVIS